MIQFACKIFVGKFFCRKSIGGLRQIPKNLHNFALLMSESKGDLFIMHHHNIADQVASTHQLNGCALPPAWYGLTSGICEIPQVGVTSPTAHTWIAEVAQLDLSYLQQAAHE